MNKFILIILLIPTTSFAEGIRGFIGKWNGSCQSGNTSFKMELRTESIQRGLAWKITYTSSDREPVIRNYALLQTEQPNTFLLDEGGGATFIEKLEGNMLYGLLKNESVLMYSKHEIVGNEMLVEMNVFKAEMTSVNGRSDLGSYMPTTRQVCRLKK